MGDGGLLEMMSSGKLIIIVYSFTSSQGEWEKWEAEGGKEGGR